jgi:VWFA-related protein
MSKRLSFVTLVVTAAILVLPLASQTPQPPAPAAPQRPAFRTEANFVRVDAFPTVDGRPIRDLTLEDFAVFEDGVRQNVSTFEHVEVRTGVTVPSRAEPNTIQQSVDALQNPRARVFVLFLDLSHVSIEGSWQVREPLVRLLDRVLGDEDLVGIMTPAMAASDIVFGRKTDVIKDGLRSRWPWGERHTIERDPTERVYEMCFPLLQDVVAEMTARKRERRTLEALQEAVNWLRDQREERKAILTVSEGWLLFRPNTALTQLRSTGAGTQERPPGPDPIGVGPDGRITRAGRNSNTGVPKSECDADRLRLAQIDDLVLFRDIMDDANRANASFYTIDPRGLPAFDTPVGPRKAPGIVAQVNMLASRRDSLMTLANNTDGFAVINSNDIDKGLRRISDDLTSYYLLGYYSTNTKLDGRFRAIQVKVARPGVEVRARRGYKAATKEEVAIAQAAAAAPIPETGRRAATEAALSALGAIRPSAPLYAHAIAVRGVPTTVWVAGEFPRPMAAATSAIVTVSTAGATNSAETKIAAGQRGFVIPVTLKVDASTPVDVRVRVAAAGEAALTDMVRIDATAGLSAPLLFRRGPSTGNRLEPAGQPLFSRTERVRMEIPTSGDGLLTSARVLDRAGAPIELPVTLGDRTDAAGQRWLTADVILAPLAPGDYLVELEAKKNTVLAAIRVVR